jgi:hypothetical protein
MVNLFLSFTIAIGGAVGLVSLGRAFALDSYLSKILPVVPILYAIVYDMLERRRTGRSARAEAGITAGRLVIDVAVSFLIKFSVEIFLVVLFLRSSGQSFQEVYGAFNIETAGTFLRGEHPWIGGKESTIILALTALVTILATGSWIGHTSRGNAILEGVLTGSVVTLINSLTSMLVLYRSLGEATVRLADSLGYILHAGYLVVLGLQILLYGFWSGLVQMKKQKGKK